MQSFVSLNVNQVFADGTVMNINIYIIKQMFIIIFPMKYVPLRVMNDGLIVIDIPEEQIKKKEIDQFMFQNNIFSIYTLL